MKFTKEDAIKELKSQLSSKVEKIDKWERTITENVETLIALVGEDSTIELSDFVAKAIPLFNTTQGMLRKENADVAKGLEQQINELKAQLEKKEPTKQNPKEPNDDVKALLQRLETLENESKAAKLKVKLQDVRKSLIGKLKEKGVKDNEWANLMLDNITLTEDLDIDTKADDLLKLYNKSHSAMNKVVTPNGTGSVDDNNKSEFDDVKALYAQSHPTENKKN